MAKDLRLDVVTTSDGKGLIETAVEADEAAKKIDKLGKQMRETAVDGGILDIELEATQKQLKELGAQFDYTGDKQILKQISTTRRYSGQLQKLKKDMEDLGKTAEEEGPKVGEEFATSVENGLMDGIKSGATGGGGPTLGLVLAGVLTSPGTYGLMAQAGALLGGAVLTGIGLAGIGSGIALSIDSDPVRAAIDHLKSDVGAGLASAASSFIGPTQQAVDDIDREFAKLQPGIARVFASISPEVDRLSAGFSGLLDEVVPAIGGAIEAAKPLLDILAADLPGLGKSVAGLFDTISANSGVASAGLQGIFTILEGVINLASAGVQGVSTLFRTMQDIAIGVATMNDQILSFAIAMATYLHLPTGPLQDLLKSSEALTEQLQENKAMLDGASSSMGALSQQAGGAAHAVDRVATALSGFNYQLGVMSAAINTEVSLDQFTIGLSQLKDQLEHTKGSLNANTAAGAQNRENYSQLVEGAKQYRQSLLDQGLTQDKADAKFQALILKLEAAAIAGGASKDAIQKLNDQLHITELMKPIKVSVEVTTTYSTKGKRPSLSTGDIPFLASGGRFDPGPIVVGERGPELLVPDFSGTVIPDLKSATTGRGGMSGGGGPVRLVLEVRGDDFGRQIMAALRPEIRGEFAGDVTAALAGYR